jgi:signal transduction histidine kinase
MKFSTRLILYYLFAALISMTIVGMAIAEGIKRYGLKAVEETLIEESKSSSVYITQILYLEKPQSLDIKRKTATYITNNLSVGNRQVRIYNRDLNLLSSSINGIEQEINQNIGQSKHLYSALKGDYSYVVHNNNMFFASPVEFKDNTLGVLELVYPLNFLGRVLTFSIRILIIGAVIFSVLIILLSIYIARIITKPIKLLVEGTTRYSKRDFAPIEIQGSDEIGRLSKSFNLMGMQLQEYIHMQKQFVDNVSHELRTPLTAIRGYSEYLMEEIKGRADLEKAVYHLHNESNRLSKLVDELLLLSRIDAKQQNFDMESLNFTELIEEVIEKLILRADKSRIRLQKELEPELFVIGDRDKLTQSIINIIGNAIKYSPPQSIVKIVLTKDENHANMCVLDSGPGIKPEDIDKVFERFFRASNVKGTVGTGLGLSIAEEIIEAHQGTIKLENRTEGGTIAKISLPIE